MNPQLPVGKLVSTQAQGKFFIIKLQERSDKDENLTLESPGVRQQVVDSLLNARKQLLVQAFAAVAMNEAKIVNNLAQKVVDTPNDLSGARPAVVETPNANANAATNAPANANTNANTSTKPANTAANKPAAPAANTAANVKK
jgi:hypothetical protein